MSRAPWRDRGRLRSRSQDQVHVDSSWREDPSSRRRRSRSRPKEDQRWSDHTRWQNPIGGSRPKEDHRSSRNGQHWHDRQPSRSRPEGNHRRADARWHDDDRRLEDWGHSCPREGRRSFKGDKWRNRQDSRSRSRPEHEHREVDAHRHESGTRRVRGSRSRPDNDRREADGLRHRDCAQRRRSSRRSQSRPEDRFKSQRHVRDLKETAQDEELGGLQGKSRSRKRSPTAPDKPPAEETMEVPQSMLGRIIGRRGIKIKEIRKESGADIDTHGGDAGSASRVVIRGSSSSVARAVELVSEVMQDAEKKYGESAQDDWVEEVVDIPQNILGLLIGKGGERVTKLQNESGAKLDVDKTGEVRIRGPPDSVVQAIDLISEFMDGAKEKLSTADEYKEVEETIEVPPKKLGRLIGKAGENVKKLEVDSGAKINVNDKDQPPTVHLCGPGEAVSRAIDLIKALTQEVPSQSSVPETLEESLEFPLSEAGKIIGTRGATIKKMRDESGANIQVVKEIRSCRVVITGSPEQIGRAQKLVRSVVDISDSSPRPRHKKKVATGSDMFEETLHMQPQAIGRLCGRGGQTVMKLQEESGAKIKIDKLSNNAVSLRGPLECIARAKEMIAIVVGKAADLVDDVTAGPDMFEETIDMPSQSIGRICGKGGQTIMKLQEDSGAKINIDKVNNTAVILRGSRECIARAKDLIAIVAGKAADMVEEVIDVPPKMLGRIFGHGGKTIMKLQDDSGAKINVDKANLNSVSLKGSPECVERARELIVDWIASETNGIEETMWVPPEWMGLLIGKGGQTIMQLQVESGAKIDADKVNKNSVHISGSSECVARAQQMIADLISDGADKIAETVQVSQSSIGRIFGHGGEHIMKLQDVTGAKIDVDKTSFDAVHLSGSTKSVAEAKDLVSELFAEPEADAGHIKRFWAKVDMRIPAKKPGSPSRQRPESHRDETREARPKPSTNLYLNKLESASRELSSAPPRPSQAKPSQAPHLSELARSFEDEIEDDI